MGGNERDGNKKEKSILACYVLQKYVKMSTVSNICMRWWRATIYIVPWIEWWLLFHIFLNSSAMTSFYRASFFHSFFQFFFLSFRTHRCWNDNYNCCLPRKTRSGLNICMFGHIKCMICFNNFCTSIREFLFLWLSFLSLSPSVCLSYMSFFLSLCLFLKFDYFTRDLAASHSIYCVLYMNCAFLNWSYFVVRLVNFNVLQLSRLLFNTESHSFFPPVRNCFTTAKRITWAKSEYMRDFLLNWGKLVLISNE